MDESPRLIVASARLPVCLGRDGDEWVASASPGGLAAAMRSVAARRGFTWIGWPGIEVAPEEQASARECLAATDSRLVPVFLDDAEQRGFYEELSNRVLWPLFHNLPTPVRVDEDAWDRYRAVNVRFAEAIAAHAEPGDQVWVHDYQLTLVPALLRAMGVEAAIGFFLHIPFPSSETYRALPVREPVLRGMLGADLLGFHTYEYVVHFRRACLRVLGLDSEPELIRLTHHQAHLTALPIGVDPEALRAVALAPEVRREEERLAERFPGLCVILGVARLDYTKGLKQKLVAYDRMLQDHPELHGKVVLIQVAAPSRTQVSEYQDLKREVDELVGHVNGTYGSLDWTPLVYINRNLPPERLAALYRVADVAAITPVRDGMNLVALEYVASRGDRPGTLILSEFTGAASCLSGARLVNPHNTVELAEALAEAVAAAEPDGAAFEEMRRFVERNTSSYWAQEFLRQLEVAHEESRGKAVPLSWTGVLGDRARAARRPLVLLDYDGTLVAHQRVPEAAAPTAAVERALRRLVERATVYVISGRPATTLDRWIGHLGVGLVCEHGLAIRPPGGQWSSFRDIDVATLRGIAEPLLLDFQRRTPGSQIEYKRASIAWHYRGVEPELGNYRARDLMSALESVLSREAYTVLNGSRVIEVRHADMSKGVAASMLLQRYDQSDFILCVGNDRTDEEMYEAVLRTHGDRAIVCHIGPNTVAPYSIPSPSLLLPELEALAELLQHPVRTDQDSSSSSMPSSGSTTQSGRKSSS